MFYKAFSLLLVLIFRICNCYMYSLFFFSVLFFDTVDVV